MATFCNKGLHQSSLNLDSYLEMFCSMSDSFGYGTYQSTVKSALNIGEVVMQSVLKLCHAALSDKRIIKNPFTKMSIPCLGHSAAHYAAIRGNTEVLALLKSFGGSLIITDQDGGTLLHLAAEWGHLRAVHMLVRYGLSPSIKDHNGHTPEDRAVQRGFTNVVAFLQYPRDDLFTMVNSLISLMSCNCM